MRRLCIILALKEAYLKAIGKNSGVDYRLIDCDIPQGTVRVNGESLVGWEFRIFGTKVGVARGHQLVEEKYQCVIAIYKGWQDTKLLWELKDDIEKVQFITLDDVMTVCDRLR